MTAHRNIIRFLTSKQVIRLYKASVIFAEPTQPAMLESALESPRNHKAYGEMDVFDFAGILARRIILNHPFQDGNKWAALTTTDLFPKINGFQLQLVPLANEPVNDGLRSAHAAVASEELDEIQLAQHYRKAARPLETMTNEIKAYAEDAEEH